MRQLILPYRLLIIGCLLTSMFLPALPARAQESITPSCVEQKNNRIAHEQRMFRSVIYGQKESADLPLGSIRFDTEYDTWIKKANNEWRSLNEGNESLTWGDSTMDSATDIPARRGLLEVRKALTSELIPPIVQSMRALRCRMEAVCMAAALGEGKTATVKVTPDGCQEFELPRFDACSPASIPETGPGSCKEAINAVLSHEMAMTQLVVAYDAAYRSLMQFAGSFDQFLTDFRFPLIQPLWQMIRTLGVLDNLPCFASQCNE